MILPGISGSFILLILGKYEFMMSTIADIVSGKGELMDFAVVLVFVLGALTGIIAFSKFLHWLLERYHRPTLLILAGFIIGSLVKVWPWSNMPDIICSQFPEAAALMETAGTGPTVEMYASRIDPHIGGAVLFALAGFILVVGIELVTNLIAKSRNQGK